MESHEFKRFRKKLDKTQEGMAHLLGVSVKAIRSYEQGWRSIPTHAERQLLFLTAKKDEILKPQKPCWIIKDCKEERKKQCPAWEFHAGSLCWFINGTICSGTDQKNWAEKIKICKKCKAFPAGLKKLLDTPKKISKVPHHDNCFNES